MNPDDVLVQGQRPDKRSVDAAAVRGTPDGRIERFGRTVSTHHFHRSTEAPNALSPELRSHVVEPGSTAGRTLQGRIAVQLQGPLAHPLAGPLVHPPQSNYASRAACVTTQDGPGKSGGEKLDRGGRDQLLVRVHTPEEVALLIGYRDSPRAGRRTRSLAIPATKLKLKALCHLLAVSRHDKRPRAKQRDGGCNAAKSRARWQFLPSVLETSQFWLVLPCG